MSGIRLFRFSIAVVFCIGLCLSGRAQPPAALDRVKQVLKDGDSAFARGDYQTAQQSFEKAWQSAGDLPADASLRYDILKRQAASSTASGQFDHAERYVQRAIEWRESVNGPKDPKIVDDLLLSINLDLRTKDYDRALAAARRVQEMHIAANSADSLPVADDWLRIGQIHLAAKNPRKALPALNTAYKLRTSLAGSLDPGLLPALDSLNDAFRALQGDGGGGNEMFYRQALMIREMVYGTESTELLATIEGLAETYFAGSEYPAAEPLYERLLHLWEKLAGPDHPMVAITLDKLVVFYWKEGKPEKARQALQRSIDIRAEFLAIGLSYQAADEKNQGHVEQARALYNRALAALGPPGPANQELVEQIRKALINRPSPPEK